VQGNRPGSRDPNFWDAWIANNIFNRTILCPDNSSQHHSSTGQFLAQILISKTDDSLGIPILFFVNLSDPKLPNKRVVEFNPQ
jgi:hypothetical protein